MPLTFVMLEKALRLELEEMWPFPQLSIAMLLVSYMKTPHLNKKYIKYPLISFKGEFILF